MEATKKDICDVCHKKTTYFIHHSERIVRCPVANDANATLVLTVSKKKLAYIINKTQTYLRAGTKVTLTTIITCDICKTDVAMLRKFKESVRRDLCRTSSEFVQSPK
jgi:hypothetical protein